ncbi:sulfatase-like hydrolase/transferase [Lacinutrix iliipiscaria]|uniref:Sulfatase-like hydrolase/transferase n=1 Tax=Lacinutrix iliipiscaria TaxID=1230532 RepID=A0ABW5WMY7_9FLAO
MLNNLRLKVIAFIDSKKNRPILAAFASGLYPLVYYYNKNFTLVNSWTQFFYFVFIYLILPAVVFYICYNGLKKLRCFNKYLTYIIPVLNLSVFAFLIVISTYGHDIKVIIIAIIVAFILAILLRKQINKIIVFQFILSALVFVKLIPDFHRHITYSSVWMEQPDDIEEALFKKKPNIYVIQPDGYANFSELKNDTYNFDNSVFESFLSDKNFKLYDDFRSNYNSTLSSNTSMFAMKHHQYNNPKPGTNELYNSRDIIVGKNPVISILKKNDYKTFLILEKSYLLVNRPKIEYDYCNIDYSEVSYQSRGFEVDKQVTLDVEQAIKNNTSSTNFFFIEKISPGHVANSKAGSKGKTQERMNYLEALEASNEWLTDLVTRIERLDKNSLIVIVADHGGFVGLDYTLQCKEKQTERDLVYTIFTSALAIKWPGEAPAFDDKLKSNVNLFRVLFSYLSEDETYLDHLQDDKSYSVIETGAPYGVYELINEKGEVVFNAFSK